MELGYWSKQGDMLDGKEPSFPLSETYTDKQDIERPLRTIYW